MAPPPFASSDVLTDLLKRVHGGEADALAELAPIRHPHAVGADLTALEHRRATRGPRPAGGSLGTG
jgi:hypothetical protein